MELKTSFKIKSQTNQLRIIFFQCCSLAVREIGEDATPIIDKVAAAVMTAGRQPNGTSMIHAMVVFRASACMRAIAESVGCAGPSLLSSCLSLLTSTQAEIATCKSSDVDKVRPIAFAEQYL